MPVYRHEVLWVITYPPELDFWIANLKNEESLESALSADIVPRQFEVSPTGRIDGSSGSGVPKDIQMFLVRGVGVVLFGGVGCGVPAPSYGLAILTFSLGAVFIMAN